MSNESNDEFARVKQTFLKFHESDRPWIEISAQMHDHAMFMEKVPAKKFYWDAKAFVTAFYEVAAYYQIDNPICIADNYNFEVEALGGKMIYSDIAMPTIDHRDPLIKGPEDLHKIRTPDFHRDGRMPFSLEYIKLSTEFGNKLGTFCSPFSLAVGLVGYVPLLKNMRKQPQFTKDLLDMIVDNVLVPYFKMQKEYCGVTASLGGDAWTSMPYLADDEVEKWVIPFNRKLIAKCKEFDFTVVCSSGLYREENPGSFDSKLLLKSFEFQTASQGWAPSLGLYSIFLPDYPYEVVCEYMTNCERQGKSIRASVNLDPRLLRDGPIDQTIENVKRGLQALAGDHAVAVNLSNIPADTPSERVHAAIAAVHTYGRKPIAQNMDQVDFHIPHYKSFEEWKRDHS